MLKITKLNKYYNRKRNNEIHVINNTTISFDKTGLVCILGESGSGKTTLLNTIGGLDRFDSGTIQVNDQIITSYSNKKADDMRNENIGYIFQNYYLLQNRTVYYNILLALYFYSISLEEKNKRIDYVLNILGMMKYKKRLASQLSGGQQQRVAIARALVKSPSIIIADEPTGNLDEKNTFQIMSVIKKISQDCLVVLVTHEKKIAHFFADRIIEIKDGQIISDNYRKSNNDYKFAFKEDNNVYLDDFQKEQFVLDNLETNYYYKSKINFPIRIDLVTENDNIYLKVHSEGNIKIIDNNSETQIFAGKKPQIEAEDIQKFEYSLEKITKDRSGNLSFRDTVTIARANIKAAKKRRFFMNLSLIATVLIFVLLVLNVMTSLAVDEIPLLEGDKNTINITYRKQSYIGDYSAKKELYESLEKIDETVDYVVYPKISLTMNYWYSGFRQISNQKLELNKFTVLGVEVFDIQTLKYGRLPEKYNEIIVDTWTLEKMLVQQPTISDLKYSPDFFLNCHFYYNGGRMLVVGISESSTSAIYMRDCDLLSLVAPNGTKSIGLSKLKEIYPDDFADVTLLDNQYIDLTNSPFSIIPTYFSFENDFTQTFSKVNFSTTNKYDFDFVFSDGGYQLYRTGLAYGAISTNVYSLQKKELIQFIENYEYEGIEATIEDYFFAIDNAKEAAKKSVMQNVFILIIVTSATLLFLYYTIRSDLATNIYDIGVFRSIGISTKSLVFVYLVEIVIMTTFTSIVTLVLADLLIWLINLGNFLSSPLIFPWYAFLGIALIIYLINILIGLIPILSLIKIPPAQLTAKYDI